MVDTPTADSPREPDISHVNPLASGTWFGHPRQLKRLFTTEMWERFGYYGMRAILTLYLVNHFLFSDTTAAGIYGGFTALVYLTPLIGGLLADQYLGSKRSVKFGAILMSLGYLTFASAARRRARSRPSTASATRSASRDRATRKQRFITVGDQRLQIRGNDDRSVSLLAADGSEARRIAPGGMVSDADRSMTFVLILLLGLSLVTIGNGFFKPNISTIVGSLYDDGDRRRDAGFTIFYMGINLGSLVSQFFCPLLAAAVGWWAGFGLAAIGMACSWRCSSSMAAASTAMASGPRTRRPIAISLIYVGALRRHSGRRVPVLEPDELCRRPRPAPASAAISCRCRSWARSLFSTFLLSVPAILIWSYIKGSAHRIPDDGRGDGADRLQRRVLDPVRAGGLVADPVRRAQHRARNRLDRAFVRRVPLDADHLLPVLRAPSSAASPGWPGGSSPGARTRAPAATWRSAGPSSFIGGDDRHAHRAAERLRQRAGLCDARRADADLQRAVHRHPGADLQPHLEHAVGARASSRPFRSSSRSP